MKQVLARAALFVASIVFLLPGAADASVAAKKAEYAFLGYNLHGIHGADLKSLSAKLPHKPGDRITRADISADAAIVEKELQAQHVQGHLFTTMAEKKGRVWIVFDLIDNRGAVFGNLRELEVQRFEGVTRVSPDALSKASGLKLGDVLTPEKLNAARSGITAEYAKAAPGKAVKIVGKMQGKSDGKVVLTWTISEPQ